MTESLEGEIEALLDASTDPDDVADDKCGAYGPKGDECSRDRGHRDGTSPQLLHVGYSTDHYQSWPVGWAPAETRIAKVLDPTFGQNVTGTPEHQQGFNECLELVRRVLRTPPYPR